MLNKQNFWLLWGFCYLTIKRTLADSPPLKYLYSLWYISQLFTELEYFYLMQNL